MYKDNKRKEVFALREQGKTFDEISSILNISKSTVSRWMNTPLSYKKRRIITDKTRKKLSEAAKKGNAQRTYKRIPTHEMKSFTHIRKRIFEERGRKCEACGWSEVNSTTGIVPVQVHHKDGNKKNNYSSNLIVLCPNCHSLTDNFMFYGRKHSFN